MANIHNPHRWRYKDEAFNPDDGRTYEVYFSYDRCNQITRLGRWAVYEMQRLVLSTLSHPSWVFEGLCEDDDDFGRGEGWRCYVSTPSCAYNDNGEQIAPFENKVYLVFMDKDRFVYNWRWEICDNDDKSRPQGYNRFKKELYHRG